LRPLHSFPTRRSSDLAFLAEACAGDAALRAEVEDLLASYDTNFLAQPAASEFAEMIVGAGEQLTSGQRISQYEIIKPIAAGGMRSEEHTSELQSLRHL